MMGAGDLAKMVPGFEFLQGLMKGGAAGLPAIGQWVAPTLDPAELEKRINDLRTVQFWLEQNARLIGGTIQALEVQRMTLSTLRTMNLPMADLHNALKIPPRPEPAAAAAPEPEPEAEAEAEAEPAAEPAPPSKKPGSPGAKAAPSSSARAAKATPAVDPMQWWGALTQQFTEIASKALKDTTSAAAAVAAPIAAPVMAMAKPRATVKAKATAPPPARKRKG